MRWPRQGFDSRNINSFLAAIERELFQLTGQTAAVVADGVGQQLGCGGFELKLGCRSAALHQLDQAGPIPDRWQGELFFLSHFPQGLGGAEPGIGLTSTHQHEVALLRDQRQGRL